MKPKKKKKMPTIVAEVWDEAEENLISTHESLCDAIASADVVPSIRRHIFYLHGSTWIMWDGPRPKNPPGR